MRSKAGIDPSGCRCNHRLPGNAGFDLDSKAYDFIPEGHPLTDPRKEKILRKHLLDVGITGQAEGLLGIAAAPARLLRTFR